MDAFDYIKNWQKSTVFKITHAMTADKIISELETVLFANIAWYMRVAAYLHQFRPGCNNSMKRMVISKFIVMKFFVNNTVKGRDKQSYFVDKQ